MLRSIDIVRKRLTLSGIVQGVGFRPFVYNLARQYNLSGFVRNTGGKLQIEIEGNAYLIDQFMKSVIDNPPPLALIKNTECQSVIPIKSDRAFHILPSDEGTDQWQLVPPDTATCADCLKELLDSSDRRFSYPFINCVNCGPRFTIINELPYDRPHTTMLDFHMCSSCAEEYGNPLSRRFHAQPNACSNCGPSLYFTDSSRKKVFVSNESSSSILDQVRKYLSHGNIVALKSLGGFHLTCDATNETSIAKLRQRKNRYAKPFALMMANSSMVKNYCSLSIEEEELISGRQAPIVLLERLPNISLPNNIAPGTNLLGVMLPYTPLHHILFSKLDKPLVMTSGNMSEEPIAIDNTEATQNLSNIADHFLVHNRCIASRYDDSITRISANKIVTIRRSRGLAPEPIELNIETKKSILSFGAQLKNTFSFFQNNFAFISQHIGDLNNLSSEKHFKETLTRYKSLFRLTEEIVACDLHPDYLSTRLAEQYAHTNNLPLVKIQHHHAHIVSCMAEHKLSGPAIGIAFDGSGFGTDNTVWGGEFFITNYADSKRFACFQPTPLPGGEEAIRKPWRMTLGFLHNNEEQLVHKFYLDELNNLFGIKNVKIIRQQIEKNFNSPLTSSCGRIFDAVSSLLGICHEAHYEGQAAIELETAAKQVPTVADFETTPYDYQIIPIKVQSDHIQAQNHININRTLNQIVEDKKKNIPISSISYKFHYTIATIVSNICHQIRCQHSINNVCLSGGVFQNDLLLRLSYNILSSQGFDVFFPEKVPTNDGGISLGQAIAASALSGNLNLSIPS